MAARSLFDLTWRDVEAVDRQRAVAVLPIGAVEAHGPHLPLGTDGVIAEGMAESGLRHLAQEGFEGFVLPRLDYTAAPFAAGFPGTLSLRPETVSALLLDLGAALARGGWGCLAVANAHLDPTHLASIHAGVEALRADPAYRSMAIAFPDVTRKPWALRLTDEFRSGACHAGRYETSIVLARRPDLVHDEVRRELRANPASLVTAIRKGQDSFEDAGGPEAYFGAPAEASVEEGQSTLDELGAILAEAVLDALSRKANDS